MSTSSLASCTSDGTTGSSTNVCSNTTVINKEMFYDKCPRCKVQFDFMKRVNVTRVPLILTCKHSVCEDCIRRMVLTNSMVCPVCKVKFEASRNQTDSLPDLFPPHYTLIGHLVWAKNSPTKRNINFVSTGYTLGNRHLGGGDLQDWNVLMEAKRDEGSDDDDIEKTTLSLVFEKCIEHRDQYVNIQCDECNDIYCCYCFLENHAGHKATYLYKLNEKEASELEKLKIVVEVILAQLLVSKKQAKELKTSDSSNVDYDIKQYFADLHAKLHVAERNIRKRLLNIESEIGDLEAINSTLKSGLYRANQILNHFNLLNSKQLNVRALYEEAKELKNIPCKLVSDQEGLRPIQFLSENVFDDIEEIVSLKALPRMEYNLVPIEDLSQAREKYEHDQMRRQTERHAHFEPRSEIIKTVKRAENETKRSGEGTIRAILTHINSLNSFFIQRYSSLECLKEMNANIGRRGKKRGGSEDYKLGGVYGVSYETKNSNHWRRGKVVEILKNDDGTVQYKMYFFDYGNSQLVTKDKLKMLDIRTITRPSFSYECKLTNRDRSEFEPNAHMHLPQIIGERELYVRFMEKQANRNTVQEVDLLLTTSSGGFISVKDLLTGSSVTPQVAVAKESVLMPQLKFFKNSKQFCHGGEETVIVTYVRDPFFICVQLAQNMEVIEKMKDDLEQYYKGKPPLACIPVANTDVIVKYEDEKRGNWHRAEIKSVDMGKKEVNVYFVDWGYSTVVPWSSLRLLTEDFIKAECQGITVALADIEKLDVSKPWNEKVVNFIREFLGNTECKMLVSSTENLEVVLFQSRPAADVCLNALLVEEKYVLSTGPLSQTVCWPNMDAELSAEEDSDLSFQMVKKSGEVIVAEEDDAHLKTGMKLQVSVINFQSPDLIYIKFNKYKEIEDDLHKELQIHYSSLKSKTKNSWKVGQNCVVFDSVRHNYFRAVIKSASANGNYIVYLYDHVRELKVSRKYIFVQDAYFQQKYLCYVCKCRLANIKPAGDAGKWSSIAIEMLQKIFSTYKTIYVKKLEINEHDKMLGVIMWYCLTTPAKALEPSRVKYISINQSLIESGVAFASPMTNGIPTDNKVDEAKASAKSKDWYAMICEDERRCEQKEDEKERDSEDDELHETVQNGWPEPFKIEFPEFDAILTCVDNEGYFSVRSMEMDKYYRELEESLTTKLHSLEAAVDDADWQVNNMCTILYEGKWYRGTVLEVVNDVEISVEMIDFGSEHVVRRDQLTKCIMFPDVPPLINKVKLYDVYSKNGLWSCDDVNAILSLAPDNVRVVIKNSLNDDIPCAELYFENGLSLNDLIVQKCSHMKRYENKISLANLEDIEVDCDGGVEEEIEDRTSEHVKSYNYVCLSSPSVDKQKLFVVSVLKLDNSYNVVLSTKDSTNLEAVVGTDVEFQTQAPEQPALSELKLNEPCICMHLRKKVWSRAVVYNVDSLKYGYVSAFFVDYGTVEMVPVKDLKEILPNWLDFPVNMQIACINIELVHNNQAEFVLMQLNSLRGKSVLVEVVSQDPLKVHLYDGENLFYKDFIDCGIVKAL